MRTVTYTSLHYSVTNWAGTDDFQEHVSKAGTSACIDTMEKIVSHIRNHTIDLPRFLDITWEHDKKKGVMAVIQLHYPEED